MRRGIDTHQRESGCVVYRLADFGFVIVHGVPHHHERPHARPTNNTT